MSILERVYALPMMMAGLICAITVAASAASPAPAKRSWAEEKCVRYGKGWEQALTRYGREGLGPDFLARHAAFLASGCSGAHDVCARSPQELKMANTMVIVAMNAGMASTFPPFACRT